MNPKDGDTVKRILTIIFAVMIIFSCVFHASALETKSKITLKESGEEVLSEIKKISATDIMKAEKQEHESIYAFELYRKPPINNPDVDKYPEIETDSVTIGFPASGGGDRQKAIGKDYRLFFVENNSLIPVTITHSRSDEVTFTAEKLGTYVMFYDPRVYCITFYLGYDAHDEDSEAPEDNVYVSYTGLTGSATIEPPALPTREGYVFNCWMQHSGTGSIYSDEREEIMAGSTFRASWIKEEDYKPLEITVSHSNIIKGAEDGKTVTVKVKNSAGFRDDFIADTSDFSEEFILVGTDEVTVSNVEYIDSETIKLTLSGNSTDATNANEYYIGIRYYYLTRYDNINCTEYGSIQTNEYGFRKNYFTSDNPLILSASESSPVTDLDNDGETTLKDINKFISYIRQNQIQDTDFFDLNRDSKIDSKDILILISNILEAK